MGGKGRCWEKGLVVLEGFLSHLLQTQLTHRHLALHKLLVPSNEMLHIVNGVTK